MFLRIAEYKGREGWPSGNSGSGDAGGEMGMSEGSGELNLAGDGLRRRGGSFSLPANLFEDKAIGRDSIALFLSEQDERWRMTVIRFFRRMVLVGDDVVLGGADFTVDERVRPGPSAIDSPSSVMAE